MPLHSNSLSNNRDLHCAEIEDSIPWTVYAVCSEEKREDTRICELVDYYLGICLNQAPGSSEPEV